MRLVILGVAAALAGAALSAAPAMAEVEQSAAQPSERQLALTRQYINVMMSGQFEDAIRQMVGDEAAATASGLPAEDRRFMVDLTAELAADMIPQMVDEMVPVYAAAFSEAELEALVAFYDTDMGRSIAAKTIEVMPEANRAVMSVMPQMLDKMAARMCQHYGCEPGQLEAMQREMRIGAGVTAAPPPAPVAKPARYR